MGSTGLAATAAFATDYAAVVRVQHGPTWAHTSLTACLPVTQCRFRVFKLLQEVIEFPDVLVRAPPGPILVPDSSELQVGCGNHP